MSLAIKIRAQRQQQVEEKKALAPWEGSPPADMEHLQQPPPSVTRIIHEVLDQNRENRQFFRPSGFGGCPRSQVFQYLQVPPTNPPQLENNLQMILGTGTHLHEMLQGYLALHPGIFYAPEVPIWIPELDIKGSCDGILTNRTPNEAGSLYRWGVEFKTIGSKGFETLTKPKPEHVIQASIYARLAGVYWISIVYFCKDNAAMKEYPVHYDPETWEGIVAKVRELQGHVRRGTLPVYTPKVCQNAINFCQHVAHCHQIEGKEIPRWWAGFKQT